MKIILTNSVKEKNNETEVLQWIDFMFNEEFQGRKLYDFDKLKNQQLYKIRSRSLTTIFKKDKENLVIVSFKNKQKFKNRNSMTYKIEELEDKIKVFRVDFNGEYQPCGYVQEDKLILRNTLQRKYNMPEFPKEIGKEDFVNFIYFDEEEEKYILKFFERNEFDYSSKTDKELLHIFNSKFEKGLRSFLFRNIRNKEERIQKVNEFIGLTEQEKINNIRDGKFNKQSISIGEKE